MCIRDSSHLAEDRVAEVEVRRGRHGDEELGAVRRRAGVRHGEQERPVERQVGVELVAELVARAAGPVTDRVAALDHEAVDDAVKDESVCLLYTSRCV